MRLGLMWLIAAFALSACSSTSKRSVVTWPTVDVLPTTTAKNLKRPETGTVLRQGEDGFLYVVGDLSGSSTGTPFYARYSGDWPLDDLPRPPLATGHFLRKVADDVAVISLDYRFPETKLDGLVVTWEQPPLSEEIGKGIAPITKLNPTKDADVELSIGRDLGVQPGDIYAVLKPTRGTTSSDDLQLSRRVKAICLVNNVEQDKSQCRLWRGSALVPGLESVAVGDVGVFLEHTYGKSPRPATISIAKPQTNDELQTRLITSFTAYVGSIPNVNINVAPLNIVMDAQALSFHQEESRVHYDGTPNIIVGLTTADIDGQPHLIANYTGVGPATGPGMIAAPPERGIDLGRIDNISEDDVRGLAGVVVSAALVYRGQTSEALIHLRHLLNDQTVASSTRWHARDQYAMRWAALGFDNDALWLIKQDEAAAKQAADQKAYLNALGTRVRLLDRLELPEQALQSSKEYLDAREVNKPDASYLSALGMHAEMQAGAGKVEAAKASIKRLQKHCPQGCSGNLSGLLSGAFWAFPPNEKAYRAQLLKHIVALVGIEDGARLASARLVQGLLALSTEEFDSAMRSFLEAETLFDQAKYTPGVGRAKYYQFLTEMSRQQPQRAFEAALDAIQNSQTLRDFDATARIYERMGSLYTGLGADVKPGPYLGAGEDVLQAGVQIQLAKGDFSKTSEALFSLGTFLMKVAKLPESQMVFQRGVLFSIRSTRFDIASMCHLSLGVIARERGDGQTFIDEIRRATIMAQLSGDESIKKAIENVMKPRENPEDQLL